MPVSRFGQLHTIARHAAGYLLYLAAGLLLSLAFPNEIIPGRLGDRPPAAFGWLALLPVMLMVLRLPSRQARWGVCCYGLGFSLGVLSWMRLFGYLPWVLVALYLALIPWLALVLVQRMRLPTWLAPLGLALAWTGLEWLRGLGLFGFAWGEVGMSQVEGVTAFLAALGGVPLITFLMLWVTGTVVAHVTIPATPRWLLPAALGVLGVLLLGGWLQVRTPRATPHRVQLTVVQPNTLRGLTPAALVTPITWQEYQRRRQVLFTLSRQTSAPGTPGLTIWPESALADPPDWEVSEVARTANRYLLLGAPYVQYRRDTGALAARYNAVYLLDPQGAEHGRYAKMHLVPFGEFVPLRSLVARYYTVRGDDIRPGASRRTLAVADVPVGVGICFESTFSGIARAYAGQGAQLLVFVTNDAWFHRTNAVRQHFNHARFRAIETGLPVARAAGTGISGFIARDGRILAEIPTYTSGTRTRTLATGRPGTCYTAFGWLFGPLCLLVTGLLLLPRRRAA